VFETQQHFQFAVAHVHGKVMAAVICTCV
jgi:hypothetical protein